MINATAIAAASGRATCPATLGFGCEHDRKGNRDGEPWTGIHRLQQCLVQVCDGLHQRQTQSCAGTSARGIEAHKPLQLSLPLRLGNSVTCIGDTQPRPVRNPD